MNKIEVKGWLHRDGDRNIKIYCSIPKDKFPQLEQGADGATPALFEITLLEKKRVPDDDCDIDFFDD